MQKLKSAYLVIFFLLVVFVITLQATRFIKDSILKGVVVEKTLPELTAGVLLDGSYLTAVEKNMRNTFALRGYCVRFEGQINYSVFREITRGEVVAGKDDHLFEKVYINYLNGLDEVSNETLARRARDLKEIQSYLEKRNTHLVFLITPSKSTVMREHVPDKFLSPRSSQYNLPYEYFVRELEKNGVTFVDGRRIITDLKAQSRYPVFPASGIHWTMYSTYHVVAHILETVERVIHRPIARIHLESVTMSGVPRYSDDDILDLSNLLYPQKLWRSNPYPKTVSEFKSHHYLPSYLVVGGSFVHSINYFLLNNPCYKKLVFFYYNSRRNTFPAFTPEQIVDRRFIWDEIKDAALFFSDFRGSDVSLVLGLKKDTSSNIMLKTIGEVLRNPIGRRFLSAFFYNRTYPDDSLCRFSQVDSELIDKKALDWEREVFSNDVIIIEANESNFKNMAGGFIEEALARLRKDAR